MKITVCFLLILLFVGCASNRDQITIPKSGIDMIWEKTKFIPSNQNDILGEYRRKPILTGQESIFIGPGNTIKILVSDGYMSPNEPTGFFGSFTVKSDTLKIQLSGLTFSDEVNTSNQELETTRFDSLNYMQIYQKMYGLFYFREVGGNIFLIPYRNRDIFSNDIIFQDKKYLNVYFKKE